MRKKKSNPAEIMMKMKMKRTIALLFAAAVAAMFAGCASYTPLPHPVTAADPGDVVKVGVLLPLTGPDADYGARVLRGVELACFRLNNGRGISNRRVRLLVRDTKSDPEEARRQVQALFREKIVGLVGPYNTREALAVKPLVESLRIPTILPMATADALTGNSDLIYRTCFSDSQQGEALAAYCWYWRKLLRIGILIKRDRDVGYSRNVAEATSNAFGELGGNVVEIVDFEENLKDFAEKLRHMVSYNPQAILVSAEPESAGKMVKSIREFGYHGLLIGPDSWDDPLFLSNCGKEPGDCAYVGLYADEFDLKEQKDFQEAFRQRFFVFPSSCAAQGYDALNMLAIGLGNAGSVEEFNRNMQSIHKVPGASALYTMKPGGEIDRTMFIMTIRPPDTPGDGPQARLSEAFSMNKIHDLNQDELGKDAVAAEEAGDK